MRHLGLVVVLACGCGVGPFTPVDARPLLLPLSVDASGTGTRLALRVFGVPGVEEPPVIGPGGLVASFAWGGASPGEPFGARLVVVETTTSRGWLFLQVAVDGGVVESNRVRVDAPGAASAEAPSVPQLVPWATAPMTSVLLVAEDFGSGRLVDAQGRALPDGSVRCERPGPPALRGASMECFVTRQAPLETTGYAGRSVRAVVQTRAGPVLTPEVALP
ncbi:MAG: hypothetical protein IAE78_16315 [Myxococcus sp.]|nr:hypothetical protein [Myxococcus sp.]